LFIELVLKQEQEEYTREEITWTRVSDGHKSEIIIRKVAYANRDDT